MSSLSSKIFGAALIGMLAAGGTGQTRLAQAAPAAELVYFSMKVQNPKTTLRCGQTVSYLVQVELQKSGPFAPPTPDPRSLGAPKGLGVLNVNVEAFSVDKTVGDFVGKTTVATAVVFSDDLASLGAKFRFKANKPGKTTLHFEGLVGKEYVSAKLDVKVLPCKFKVTTVSKWSVGMTSVGILEAEVEADEGGSFAGTATVTWVTSMLCGIASPIAPGEAELTGTINESGQLLGEITFGPMTSVGGGACGTVSVNTSNSGSLDPLMIESSPEGTSVSTQAQTVAAANGSFTGTATILVIPEAAGASAFIPGNYVASWDNFPGSLGALVALP